MHAKNISGKSRKDKLLTRVFSSRQVRWDSILRVSSKIHDMFSLHYPYGKLLNCFTYFF